MRKKWPGIALVVFAFAAILFFVLNRPPSEPIYEGKPISYWVRKGILDIPHEQEDELKAKEAVLNIGTNALPYYVSSLKAHDSRLRRKMAFAFDSWAVKHHLKYGLFSPCDSQAGKRNIALAAIGILQTNAAPAIPAITKALNDPNLSVRAAATNALAMINPAN